MALIRVKRGTTKPTTSKLTQIGELGFDYSANALYARSSSSIVKIGGEMEVVYFYEGYSSAHSLTYDFDPNYIYKIHVIASTLGSSADTSNSYIYYRTSSRSNLRGSYVNHHYNNQNTFHDIYSGSSATAQYIRDGYQSGPSITSGMTKVISFEISPTFKANYLDTKQWVAYGTSICTLSDQTNSSIKKADFAHSIQGDLGSLYINPGLNSGSPDSLSITIFKVKRK